MVSARRHRRVVHKKKASFVSLAKLLILLLIPIIFFVFVKITTKNWNGEDKVSVVVQKTDGNVDVVLFDPNLDEITTFVIPGETEVTVARNLGTLKIKNVWQLGVNEKMGGSLLAQTITHDFLFPTTLWLAGEENLGDMSLLNALKFVFLANETNIAFGDRFSISLFVLKAKSIERNNIDLGKSQFLTKTKLSDGTLGYKIPGEISERLTFYFSDNDFSQKETKISIKDSTGIFGASERVGEILEVMGGKVVSLEKAQIEQLDCIVWGGDLKSVKKVARLFNCQIKNEKGEFDIQIQLGSEFIKRF